MPSRQHTQDEPVTRVFRVHPVFSPQEGSLLEEIDPAIWRQIVHHALPLHPPNTTIRLLVVRGTAERCETIDALQLDTDRFGFLLTWELDPAEALPSLTPPNSKSTRTAKPVSPEALADSTAKRAPEQSSVIDSRQRFLRRYLSHRHSWQPTPSVLEQALTKSGYGPPDQPD